MTWRIECYWELGYGYLPYKDVTELVPEVDKWLCTPIDLGGPMGRDNYLTLIEEEVTRFMESESRVLDNIPTIEEWVRIGKWLEGKNGSELSPVIHVDGKRNG